MLEFLDIANEIVILITSLLGLLGTGVGTFFAIRNWIKAMKEKTTREQWLLIMEMADAAMKIAEKSGASGADKKDMVIESIKASALAANLDLSMFLDQLSLYIDQTIDFVNNMK